MNQLTSQTFAWHQQQQNRVTTYKAPKHEIPTNWNCAGECTQPVPDPPAGSTNEPFRSGGQQRGWLVVMSIATLAFAGLTLGHKK